MSVQRDDVAPAIALRTWVSETLMQVSRKLPPLLENATSEPAWAFVWSASAEAMPTSARARQEFARELGETPPSYDPVRVFEWASTMLWSLGVFTMPDDACDEGQGDLEVWCEADTGTAILVSTMGGRFEFRERPPSDDAPLRHWSGDAKSLRPATRTEVLQRLPTADC